MLYVIFILQSFPILGNYKFASQLILYLGHGTRFVYNMSLPLHSYSAVITPL